MKLWRPLVGVWHTACQAVLYDFHLECDTEIWFSVWPSEFKSNPIISYTSHHQFIFQRSQSWNNLTQRNINMQYSNMDIYFRIQNTLGILQHIYKTYKNMKMQMVSCFLTMLTTWNKVEHGLWATVGAHILCAILWCNTNIVLTGKATRKYSHQFTLFHSENNAFSLGRL